MPAFPAAALASCAAAVAAAAAAATELSGFEAQRELSSIPDAIKAANS
jgi:hypothetical protein